MLRQQVMAALVGLLMLLGIVSPLLVDAKTYHARSHYTQGTYFQRHPYQKSGLIGAGVGGVAGAVLGGRGDRSGNVVKGAALGTAAGLGYQYLKRKGTFR